LLHRRSRGGALQGLRGPHLLNVVAVAVAALASPPAHAILERAGEHIHDVGAVRLFMTNLGIIGNPTYPSFSDHPSLEWPAGSAHEYLLEAGLWVGARDRRANLLGVSTAAPVNEFRPSLDPVDHIYASFDGAAGTRRFGSTQAVAEADDDEDGRIDEEFLNGKDDDGDGRIDEDFVALGSQSFACEYRDDTHEARDQLLTHVPLTLRVQQLSFTWAEGVGDLDRCVVIEYRITNAGTDALYDVMLGFFVDPDIGPKAHEGYWRDDRYAIETIGGAFASAGEPLVRGCETMPFERTVVVMEDVPDGEPRAAGGDVPGLIAAVVLGHTTHRWGYQAPDPLDPSPAAIIHLPGRASTDRTRERIPDIEKYQLMTSGQYMGNAETDDHRFVMAVGPYGEVPAGTTIDLTVALVVAADRGELAQTVASLVGRYYGRWLDLDASSFTGISGHETCLTSVDARFCGFSPFLVDDDCDEPQTQRYGHAGCRNTFIQGFCPQNPDNRCTERRTVFGCYYVDFDCNRCTPNVEGGETLVHWADTVTRVSSRPIQKRITPGDHQVVVEWDNSAEMPTAARVLPPVAGYEVWRAEGWTRPPGSSGPAEDQWVLVRTLPLPESGLPAPGVDFIVEDAAVVEEVPGPGGEPYPHYEVGRYRYVDEGLLNGFTIFYDVVPFALEEQSGGTIDPRSLRPRAAVGDQVAPVEAPVSGATTAEIRVVPNPYVTRAAWDLQPNRSDPSGRKIAFTGLPDVPARVDIFTLAGELVRTLEHDGFAGSVDWDLLSRNGQPVTSGIYLYAVHGNGLMHRGKLVIVR
jgi:hypothetical protein